MLRTGAQVLEDVRHLYFVTPVIGSNAKGNDI